MQVDKLALAVFFRIDDEPSQEIKAGLPETDNGYILEGGCVLLGQREVSFPKLVMGFGNTFITY
jgi:hypothetical protein